MLRQGTVPTCTPFSHSPILAVLLAKLGLELHALVKQIDIYEHRSMLTCKMTLLLLRLWLMKLVIILIWSMTLLILEDPMIRISGLVQRTDLPAPTRMVSWTTMKQVLYPGLVAPGRIHVIQSVCLSLFLPLYQV